MGKRTRLLSLNITSPIPPTYRPAYQSQPACYSGLIRPAPDRLSPPVPDAPYLKERRSSRFIGLVRGVLSVSISCSRTVLFVRCLLPKTAVFREFSCLNCCQLRAKWRSKGGLNPNCSLMFAHALGVLRQSVFCSLCVLLFADVRWCCYTTVQYDTDGRSRRALFRGIR